MLINCIDSLLQSFCLYERLDHDFNVGEKEKRVGAFPSILVDYQVKHGVTVERRRELWEFLFTTLRKKLQVFPSQTFDRWAKSTRRDPRELIASNTFSFLSGRGFYHRDP